MKPTRDDDAVVDLVDTILRDGAIVQADVVVTVADVPLVGISLRAAIAGMTTMREYDFLTEFDRQVREAGMESNAVENETPGVAKGSTDDPTGELTDEQPSEPPL